jgi:hypothetical protein
MAAKFVAAIDHGTTSTRCMLFDGKASPRLRNEAQPCHPRPGWVELDMDEVCANPGVIHEALGWRAPRKRTWRDRNHRRTRASSSGIGSRDARLPGRSLGRTHVRPPRPTLAADGDPSVPAPDRLAGLGIVCAEACVAARRDPASGAARRGNSVRHAGLLAPVEPHGVRRRGARDRSDERKPDPVDEPADARMGRRPPRLDGDPASVLRNPLVGEVYGGGRRFGKRPSGVLGDQQASLSVTCSTTAT